MYCLFYRIVEVGSYSEVVAAKTLQQVLKAVKVISQLPMYVILESFTLQISHFY